MKILFFIHGLCGGGAEHVASILLNHFCEKHDTYVAVTNFKSPFYPLDNRVHLIDDRINSKIKGATRIPRFVKMVQTINNIKPDIILSFLTKTNNNSLFANLLLRKKIIVSERITLNFEKSKSQRFFRKLLYPIADRIVFVTAEDCKKIKLPSKSILIYNPAMLEPYSDYNNRQKTIVTIASNKRWHQKGLDLLICAWDKIARHNPDWNLEIYGRIHNLINPEVIMLQKQERVSWKGWTYNIENVLKTKSIFILASRNEGCPNSLIEAMSQGCACIVTDGEGDQKLMITDGINGLIAKNENIDSIAEKLQMLIDDENLRRRLSAGAIEKVKEFDKNVFFAKWDELIEEVVRK
jgi:GalNAc-alpha-(1->4)-GalNAc-alpha-(1->3)-diNAcBac-PP-undecaprenol alpha-1,4-N-acetyl-D-galactosaminyltransferase